MFGVCVYVVCMISVRCMCDVVCMISVRCMCDVVCMISVRCMCDVVCMISVRCMCLCGLYDCYSAAFITDEGSRTKLLEICDSFGLC